VVELLAKGLTNPQIAAQVFVARGTGKSRSAGGEIPRHHLHPKHLGVGHVEGVPRRVSVAIEKIRGQSDPENGEGPGGSCDLPGPSFVAGTGFEPVTFGL
jgi:hypothetical protein